MGIKLFGPNSEYAGLFLYILFTAVPYLAIMRWTRPKDDRITGVNTKEIVKEKEVIVKVRCQYCNKVYDETVDNCPFCSGAR
jgi:hypothetical protein